MTEQSCLVKRLSRYIRLTDNEAAYIASIEQDEVPLVAGQSLEGIIDSGLSVLSEGWAYTAYNGATRRQITRIFLPGEMIGLAELAVRRSGHEVRMQTDGRLCRFPKRKIGDLIETLPRLAALFVALSGLDQVALRDRLGVLATAPAEERLFHLMLDLRARLSVENVGSGKRFRMPFTQEEIGSAIGTTSVTVNKILKRLRESGAIEIDRPYYRILDREGMATRIGFVDRYDEIDMSWFPSPT